ncbi:MAG: hypothetical protein R2834_07285 [Rhodothermales bacterium]
MPVVSDFTIIHGVGTGLVIGDSGHHPIFETQFNTGGRRSTGHAIITFMVRGLTAATQGPQIKINNKFAGRVEPARGADPGHWFTQTINISGALLNDGSNEFEVHAAPNPLGTDTYDDFVLKNIICHFQQEA